MVKAKIKRYVNKHGVDEVAKRMLGQYLERKANKKRPAASIKSIQDDWHRRYNESGDNWTEYGLFEANDMTDEEIQEYVDEMRVEICSPYDCTGRQFTIWIDWYRNPSGWISIIHRMGLDI